MNRNQMNAIAATLFVAAALKKAFDGNVAEAVASFLVFEFSPGADEAYLEMQKGKSWDEVSDFVSVEKDEFDELVQRIGIAVGNAIAVPEPAHIGELIRIAMYGDASRYNGSDWADDDEIAKEIAHFRAM